jgi:hypothetical protein
VTPLSRRAAQTDTSSLVLPIQLNWWRSIASGGLDRSGD